MVGDWRTVSVSVMLGSALSPKWKLVGLVRISSSALASFIVSKGS